MTRTDTAHSGSQSNNVSTTKSGKRAYVKQTDVPACSLEEALRIPQAIRDEYGLQATAPLDIAAALRLEPKARSFRMSAGAAMAYGFTDAGPSAQAIGLTELGRRVVAPTEDGDDLVAKREGFLRPRVIREFLEKYDGSPLPSEQIGRNVLERMGVDAKATERVLKVIFDGAATLGLLTEINDKHYVRLRGALRVVPPPAPDSEESADESTLVPAAEHAPSEPPRLPPTATSSVPDPENRRVFI